MSLGAGSLVDEAGADEPEPSARRRSRLRLTALLAAAVGAGLAAWLWLTAGRPGHVAHLAEGAERAGAESRRGNAAATERAEPGRRGPDRPIPVQVARARSSDVHVAQLGLGTVVPRQSVTVRSRVTGQLERVLFQEGELVKAGQLLAQVDARPFQLQLEQVEGQLARDEALLKNAALDLDRLRGLAAGVVAKQQVDTQDSLVHQYEGTVRSDQGVVDAARLQVSFTRVTAPIAGRIGLRLIDGGNYINAGDPVGIAVINAVQPICVVFSVPEDRVPSVLNRLEEARRAGGSLTVEAWDRVSEHRLATGTLLTLDNQIDPATGTVKLKAQFSNEDGALYPNQFVNARLLLETLHGATVAPTTAVQRGSQGSFVYAVGADNAVAVRTVALGPTDGDDVAIERGLAPGELVVVNGADKLREGAKVEAVGAAGPGDPTSPTSPTSPSRRRPGDRRGPAKPAP
jgi:multidrug efflux system membrane fusion protein